jgi:hypothetical protein
MAYFGVPALCRNLKGGKLKKNEFSEMGSTEILWSVSEPKLETQSLNTRPFPALDNT